MDLLTSLYNESTFHNSPQQIETSGVWALLTVRISFDDLFLFAATEAQRDLFNILMQVFADPHLLDVLLQCSHAGWSETNRNNNTQSYNTQLDTRTVKHYRLAYGTDSI